MALVFALGLAIVWMYAAIRPRFGPGPRTALIAGLTVWSFVGFIDAAAEIPMGVFPVRLHVVMSVARFVEIALAALVGAALYKEGA